MDGGEKLRLEHFPAVLEARPGGAVYRAPQPKGDLQLGSECAGVNRHRVVKERVLYRPGVANSSDPRAFVGSGNTVAEAWTGARTSRVYSFEISRFARPTLFSDAECQSKTGVCRESVAAPRSLRPRTCPETPSARTGRLRECLSRKEQTGQGTPDVGSLA